jgi:hypothetical protein
MALYLDQEKEFVQLFPQDSRIQGPEESDLSELPSLSKELCQVIVICCGL